MRTMKSVLVLLTALLIWGCSNDVVNEKRVIGVELDIVENTVVEGDMFTLTAAVFPHNAENKDLKWRSDNTAVATVDSVGNVNTFGKGKARITAVTKDKGHTASCMVTVLERIFPLEGVSLEPAELTMTVNDEPFMLTPIFTPENASNQNVTWTSSNEEVAEVTASGMLMPKSPGTTTITVTTEEVGYTATCMITIEKAPRPKLSIEYVSEYNVNPEGTGFAINHNNESGGYFNWADAMNLFAEDKNFTIDGIGYHLPSITEWLGIVPSENGGNNVQFAANTSTNDFGEKNITIGGESFSGFTADYRGTADGVSYALRFKGNGDTHRSAWRYEYTDNPDGPQGGKMMRITVRYIGPDNLTLTVDDFANAEWWNQNNSEDIVRIFPAAGYDEGLKINYNNQGTYSSSDEAKNIDRNMRMYFTNITANGSSNQAKTLGFSVRLFSDN